MPITVNGPNANVFDRLASLASDRHHPLPKPVFFSDSDPVPEGELHTCWNGDTYRCYPISPLDRLMSEAIRGVWAKTPTASTPDVCRAISLSRLDNEHGETFIDVYSSGDPLTWEDRAAIIDHIVGLEDTDEVSVSLGGEEDVVSIWARLSLFGMIGTVFWISTASMLLGGAAVFFGMWLATII